MCKLFSSFLFKTKAVGQRAVVYFWLGPESSQVRKDQSNVQYQEKNNSSGKNLLKVYWN